MNLINYLFRGRLSDKKVTEVYVGAGAQFGCDVSYLPIAGKCFGYEGDFKNWRRWEQEYAHRGFRTISLDDFISIGGYGASCDELIGVQRESGEDPIFHAEIYKTYYGSSDANDFILSCEDDNGVLYGEFFFPSTKHPITIEKNA